MSRIIPLTPSTQVKGGGGFDDIDIEIIDAVVHRKDFVKKDGTVVAQQVALATLTYKFDGQDEADPFTEDYTIGAGVPSADGESESAEGEFIIGADPEKEYGGLTDNSKFGFFMAQLGKAGYPENRFIEAGGSVKKTLIGLKGHLRGIPGPSYGKGKKEGDLIKVITKVNGLPGAGVAKPDTSKVTELARTIITKALAQKESFTKVQLGQIANKSLAGKPEQMDVVKTVLDDKFLKGLVAEGLITLEKGNVGRAASGSAEVEVEVAA